MIKYPERKDLKELYQKIKDSGADKFLATIDCERGIGYNLCIDEIKKLNPPKEGLLKDTTHEE